MEKIIHLVQQNQKKKVKFITFDLFADSITKTWGLIGGKEQSKKSVYKAINVGKANEMSAVNVACNELIRVVNKKKKEGYIRTTSLEELPEFPDPFLDFDVDNIPTEFCLSKPTQKISNKALDKLIASGNAMTFVKYNGGCHFIRIGSDRKATIFTRRWENHTRKYPKVARAIESHNLPPKTLMAVELCVDPSMELPHMLAFKKFAEISKTQTVKGICKEDQSKAWALQEHYPVRAAVFGILYWDGGQAWHWTYADQVPEINRFATPLSKGQVLFRPQSAKVESAAALFALAKKFKKAIEGFVVWDSTQAMEVTMNGKPNRRAAWKVKAYGEMDVIATHGIEGKVPGEYGSIAIARKDAEGNLVDMGAVSGLKPNEGETQPSNWTFPCVIEVTYDNVFPDTGLLQFGNFSKVHESKTVDEVDLFSLDQ